MNDSSNEMWAPSATIETLKARAKIIHTIREYFNNKGCLEVTTPLLSACGNTEPNLQSYVVEGVGYLNTSPEFHMKRLLASQSGPIYQICPAFRQDEQGTRHNREFSMLEWYRPNWSLKQLMDEVVELLHQFMPVRETLELSYKLALFEHTAIDWTVDSDEKIEHKAIELLGEIPVGLSRDELLDLLFCMVVEPKLPQEKWCFITQYPPSQASLAKTELDENSQLVAHRFELYANGLELANGYWELTDALEQLTRFKKDNTLRKSQNKPQINLDHLLIEALNNGLPECSGVAVGLDRVMMLALEKTDIKQVLSFDANRA
ncbi:EF-P lysine aminoacylase EpmA [Marinicellulosiphila megalodicopiae]|uniref:EF-P lysine aminoacylase EpmA n=1 Tax=Marinicellulosiphila megalodicopiae TaxID=2724896 RepID=UPI003BB0C084